MAKGDAINERKACARKITKLFSDIKQSKTKFPNSWPREKRTEVNFRIKIIQDYFDREAYATANERCEWLTNDFKIKL